MRGHAGTISRRGSVSRFFALFERASERRVHAFYDEIAAALAAEFRELAAAGEGQIAVLHRVATLIGLGDLDVRKPLPDATDERLAMRIAWRQAAQWSVLSLLWALVEERPRAVGFSDWAELAYDSDGKRPRAESSLPSGDEALAMRIAAERLGSSLVLGDGVALFVLSVPVFLSVADGRVRAHDIRPIAIIKPDSDRSRGELKAKDELWLADDVRELPVEGPHDALDHWHLRMTGDGRLIVGELSQLSDITPDLTLLFQREASEDEA